MALLVLLLALLTATPVHAAFSVTELLAGNGDTSCTVASAPSVGSFTPTANRLVLFWLITEDTTAMTATPTLSGSAQNLTYVQVATVQEPGSGLLRGTLFRAMGASPTAGSPVITLGEDYQNCTWGAIEIDGVDTTGTNGSGAVVQSNTGTGTTTTTFTVNLSAYADATTASVGFFGISNNNNLSAESGFTEMLSESTCCSSRMSAEWQNPNNGDTSVTMTQGSNQTWVGVALEIKLPTSARRKIAPRYYNYLWPRLTFPVAYRGGYVAP